MPATPAVPPIPPVPPEGIVSVNAVPLLTDIEKLYDPGISPPPPPPPPPILFPPRPPLAPAPAPVIVIYAVKAPCRTFTVNVPGVEYVIGLVCIFVIK